MNNYVQPPKNSTGTRWSARYGKVSMILLWALGVPIPLLLIFFLFRGCAG